jgi:hypothetical protein
MENSFARDVLNGCHLHVLLHRLCILYIDFVNEEEHTVPFEITVGSGPNPDGIYVSVLRRE